MRGTIIALIGTAFILGAILVNLGYVALPVQQIENIAGGPPMPIGVGGWVKDNNSQYAEDGVVVTVENLDLQAVGTRATQNGYYGVGIDANNGDRIYVHAEYGGLVCKRTFYADTTLVTHWCNLTINEIPGDDTNDTGNNTLWWNVLLKWNYWLFIPGVTILVSGLALESHDGKKKKTRTRETETGKTSTRSIEKFVDNLDR